MSIYNTLKYIAEDHRVRRYLMPETVLKFGGNVENCDSLLIKKDLQIGLCETDFTILRNTESGENPYVILDFGVELHGGIRILNYTTSDTSYFGDFEPQVKITFGESYAEANSDIGVKGACNDHSPRQFTVPVPALSDNEWGQTGFRFVKIELVSPNTLIKLKNVLAVSIMRDYAYKGKFECSDETINRIFDTAAYTTHLCLQNMVWDGIKRDRLVWIGDMMPECMTIRAIFGDIDIVEESLDFVCRQTPLPKWMNNFPSYSMWWIIILKDWYMSSGDPSFIENHKDYILGLLKQMCNCIKDNGEDTLGVYFFDHPTIPNPSRKTGVRALLRLALKDGAFLCEKLNAPELADLCHKKHDKIRPSKDFGGAKQIAAFLSLADMMDKTEAYNVITTDEDKGFTTFLSYFILKAIALADKDEEAVSYMKSYYKKMLDKGATSFWEDYNTQWTEGSGNLYSATPAGKKDIHGDFGESCYRGFRHSYCHGWASGPVPFLMERVLGVNIIEPGCKAIKIEPHLSGLTWAKGVYPTPYGNIVIEHKLDSNGKVISHVSAPKQVKILL